MASIAALERRLRAEVQGDIQPRARVGHRQRVLDLLLVAGDSERAIGGAPSASGDTTFASRVVMMPGVTGHLVAAALGHESEAISYQSYVKPAALESSRQRKLISVLGAPKPGDGQAA